MKKLLAMLMMVTVCFAASANGTKEKKTWNNSFKPMKATHKKHAGKFMGNLNNPGSTGVPQPCAPRKHSNPISKDAVHEHKVSNIPSLGLLR